MSIKQNFTRNVLNIRGPRTKRRIVVIESDDWGTIRMSSKEAYTFFLKNGFPVDKCPYNSNDALESNEDLEKLFEVLSSVKDSNNNPAIITANNITANPDFKKIKSDNFRNYHYEPFTDTLKKYSQHDRVYALYKEGISGKLFRPQFHGREHINLWNWLNALQKNDEDALLAFEKEMFSVSFRTKKNYPEEYLDAFGSVGNLKEQHEIITDGLKLFESLWGYKSKSFIAPCYVWDSSLEKTLFSEGVKYLQGIPVQLSPLKENETQRGRRYHFQGEKNVLGQRYLIRNAFFEPALYPKISLVEDCLERIKIAFRWNKPAIIGSHRLNFIGFINQENRARNLKLFSILLKEIIKNWPEVEFMSSDQLGDAIYNDDAN